MLSPDGAAPPVPVASSSPVPLRQPAPGPKLPDTEAKEDEDDDDDDHIDHDVNETQSYHTDSEEEGAAEAASRPGGVGAGRWALGASGVDLFVILT